MTELRKKTLNGLIWSAVDGYGGYILKFGISIIIARLLEPEDYGLVGMMAIFIAIATMLADGGFQDALIQKKNPTNIDYSSVFVFKIILVFALYAILYLSAGLIADFFNEPRLVLIAKVMGLSFVISGFGGIHVAWFVKNIRLKNYAKINTSSIIVSGIIGVSLAYYGFGVWALIIQTISGNFIRTVSFWIFNSWRPSFAFSMAAMKKLFSFGWKMFAQQLIHTTFTNIYFPLIGKLFPIETLGYFTRAKRFQLLVVDQTWLTLAKVLFPIFSSIQDDKVRFTNAFRRAFSLMSFLIYPIVTILIVSADPFIRFFLTEKWIPVVPYMQLMYVSGFLAPFIMFNLNAVNAQGRSDITLKLNIVIRIILLIAIVISINFGVIGMLVALIIVTIIAFAITAYYCGKRINFGLLDQFRILVPSILVSLIAFSSGFSVLVFVNIHDLFVLILQTSVVIVIYYSLMKIFKPQSYKEFKELVSTKAPTRLSKYL